MGKVTPQELKTARGLLPVFQKVAAEIEWPEELRQVLELLLGPDWYVWTLMGICSRETRFGLLLDKNGTGDRGHGLGLMQIDDRSFPEFRHRNYRDPETNISMAGDVLKGKYDYLADHFGLFAEDYARLWWGAVAAYNCGEGNVRKALERGRGVDQYTTGKDYSADVKGRAVYLAREL
ncbi:MAG: hypothetical protein C4567_18715 [Deltaproteobacteria bacterium]|nr:MAG: hypothetical protein C4567_18715 [Deltaproteobacteria bacterium]